MKEINLRVSFLPLKVAFFGVLKMIIFRNLLSDKPKKRFENPTFIGLTQLSRMNTILRNHLHISNGVLLMVNISHIYVASKVHLRCIKVVSKLHPSGNSLLQNIFGNSVMFLLSCCTLSPTEIGIFLQALIQIMLN